MTVQVRFRPEAKADLTEALGWYRERGLGLGDEFLRALIPASQPFNDCLKVARSYIGTSGVRSCVVFPMASFIYTTGLRSRY